MHSLYGVYYAVSCKIYWIWEKITWKATLPLSLWKIKSCGYPRAISGEAVYEDICDQIDGKENGSYVLLSKFEDDAIFEYHITVMDQDFNLGILTMRLPEGVFEVNFDE